MSRPAVVLRKTLDLSTAYLALTGVALPFTVILRLLLHDTTLFLVAVGLMGVALSLTVMPHFENRIRIFSREKQAVTASFAYASMTVKLRINSASYPHRVLCPIQDETRMQVWVIDDTENCNVIHPKHTAFAQNQAPMNGGLYRPPERLRHAV